MSQVTFNPCFHQRRGKQENRQRMTLLVVGPRGESGDDTGNEQHSWWAKVVKAVTVLMAKGGWWRADGYFHRSDKKKCTYMS